MSSLLFCLAIDPILPRLEARFGLVLSYMDDCAVLHGNSVNSDRIINFAKDQFGKIGMTIKPTKCHTT